MALTVEVRNDLRVQAREARERGDSKTAFVRGQARARSVSERWVWQVLADPEEQRRLTGFVVDDAVLDVLYRHRGDRRRAYQELAADDKITIGYRWFAKRIVQQVWPDELAFIRKGAIARRAASATLRWEASDRNAIWAADHVQLGIPVRLTYGGRLTVLYLTYFIDCWSRRVMGWVLDERQTADVVNEALLRSVRIADDLDAGGVPRITMHDNGQSLLSALNGEAADLLGFESMPVEPYHPTQNGKVERCHQTLMRMALGDVPGWRNGPRDLARRLYDQGETLPEDVARARMAQAVHEYNHDHSHSAIRGLTPHARWLQGGPIRCVPDARLAFALWRRKIHKLQPSGVWKHGGYYWDVKDPANLRRLIGHEVAVSWIPDDDSFVAVFTLDGQFLATLPRNADHTETDRSANKKALRERQGEQDDRMERIREEARERHGTETVSPLELISEAENAAADAKDDLARLLLGDGGRLVSSRDDRV
jgi:transposase InsO family protein